MAEQSPSAATAAVRRHPSIAIHKYMPTFRMYPSLSLSLHIYLSLWSLSLPSTAAVHFMALRTRIVDDMRRATFFVYADFMLICAAFIRAHTRYDMTMIFPIDKCVAIKFDVENTFYI